MTKQVLQCAETLCGTAFQGRSPEVLASIGFKEIWYNQFAG